MFSRISSAFKGPSAKKILGLVAKITAGALIFVLLVEVGLRALPALIPERLLAEFNPKTRSEIAQRRGLPTLEETVLIHRDDNGPELRIPKPFAKRNWPGREPGTVDSTQVDEMGFCNPEGHRYDQPAIDLISLGDSFIWCTAIDPKDTWTSKLASLTGNSTYNLAATGTGLHEHVQVLKQFGIQKAPRFVIMAVFEGNDLEDAVSYGSYIAEIDAQRNNPDTVGSGTGAPFAKSPSAPVDPCRILQVAKQGVIGRYSYASNVLLVLVQQACSTVASQVLPESIDGKESGEPQANFGYSLVYPGWSMKFDPRDVGSNERVYAERLRSQGINLEIFDQPLDDFVHLSKEHDFVPIVVYTPAVYTAYAENVVFDDAALDDLLPWFSYQQRKYFEDQGSDLGYVFLDLTPYLQSAAGSTDGKDGLLYFRSNRHLTQRGHTVAANAISGVLDSIDGGPNVGNIQQR